MSDVTHGAASANFFAQRPLGGLQAEPAPTPAAPVAPAPVLPRPRPRPPAPTPLNVEDSGLAGPLGLRLAPSIENGAETRLSLASLLLAGLSNDERDPVIGVLEEIAADVWLLHAAINKAGSDIGDLAATTGYLMRLERRIRVASELHRRLLETAGEATSDGEEGAR